MFELRATVGAFSLLILYDPGCRIDGPCHTAVRHLADGFLLFLHHVFLLIFPLKKQGCDIIF